MTQEFHRHTHLLESQIQGLDALVTVVLSSEDPSVKALIYQLAQDEVMAAVMDGVRDRRSKFASGSANLQEQSRLGL
jgi:hypothetical protein